MANLQGKCFIIAGPPCSGKGTQCKRLSSRLGLVHVSTGDIFRELAESGTAQGLRVKQLMDAGSMVPDDLAIHLIKQRLAAQDVQERGALLDGYPRTIDQAAGLVNECDITGVVLLEPENEQVLADRAPHRRMDPETGEIYNLESHPPEDLGVAERLTVRPLDQDSGHFQNRVKVWRRYIDKVLPVFRDYGVEVMDVDCGESIEVVENEIAGSLEALSEAAAAGGSRPRLPPPPSEGPDRAFVHVAPCSEVGATRDTNVCVSVQVPEEGADRAPVDVCCVVDVSASMRAKATREDENGELVDDGLTILNLVQHAIKTVMCTLTENDRLSIVAFNGKASIESTLKYMDEAGRQESLVALEQLQAKGKTNLWDGLFCGMESLRLGSHAPQALQAATEAQRPSRTADSLPEDLKLMVRRKEISLENALSMVAFDEDQGELQTAGRPAMPQLETQVSETGLTRLKTILLLTDGQPTCSPPHGHVKELQDYKDKHPEMQIQINTFGFGYQLDSALLLDLAKEGYGTYAFIPHAVIMATCFVNSIANVLSTLCQDAELSLIPRNGAQFAGPTLGKHDESAESWGRLVKLGPLQLGQSRDLVVPLRIPAAPAGGLGAGGGGGGGGGGAPYLEAVLSYATPGTAARRVSALGMAREPTPTARLAELRGKMVTAGYKALDKAVKGGANFIAANKAVSVLTAEIQAASAAEQNATAPAAAAAAAGAGAGSAPLQSQDIQKGLKGLHIDVSGRMTKALNGEDRFIRWGQHYIRALVRSHQVQICTNKMDVGLRVYGGALFSSLKDQGEEIFKQLPAPTPAAPEPTLAQQQAAANATAAEQARQRAAAAREQAAAQRAQRAATMSTYVEANVDDDGYCGGGCFGPASTVRLLSGDTIEATAVADIKAGDRVVVASGSGQEAETAEVRCVVRIRRSRKKHLHQFPSGLTITGGHPMKDANGEWKRPRDLAAALDAKPVTPHGSGDYFHVYNFILSDCHILMVNDTACVTFGHGLSGDVAGHDYFGNMDRVVADLTKIAGWKDGSVEVSKTIRGETGAVTGMC